MLKDATSVLNKTQNIELYQILLDAQQKALDLQAENSELKKQIEDIKDMKDLESKIKRHPINTIVVLESDNNIKYCSVCWDSDRKLIQMMYRDASKWYRCRICSNSTDV